MKQTNDAAEHSLLCLPAGDLFYGFELDCVLETVRDVPVTPVPCLPPYYCGVCNRKGSIVPVVSLSRLTGTEDGAAREHAVIVVIRGGDCACGLLTGEQPTLLDVSAAREVGGESAARADEFLAVRRIYAAEQGVVLAVDAEATMENLTVCG